MAVVFAALATLAPVGVARAEDCQPRSVNQDLSRYVELLSRVTIVRMSESGESVRTEILRGELSRVCPDCVTVDNQTFFESAWVLQSEVQKTCSNLEPGSIFEAGCELKREWLDVARRRQYGQPVPIGALSYIFSYLRTLAISFEYGEDGCYARADEMAAILTSLGIACDKIVILDRDEYLTPPNTWTGGRLSWRYHIAPLVRARLADGQVVERVVDPSVSDHLLSVDEWRAVATPQSCPRVAQDQLGAPRGCVLVEVAREIASPTKDSVEVPGSKVEWTRESLADAQAVVAKFLPEALRRRALRASATAVSSATP